MKHVVGVAPGRANIIGEHVDYNDGWVLPFAVDQYTQVSLKESPDRNHRVISSSFGEEFFPTGNLTPSHSWSDYVKGIVHVLQQRFSIIFPPLCLTVSSDVPIGAGLSSSAAIEVATLIAIESFFDLAFEPKERFLLCQKAENEFVGVRCGVMDQFISVFGKEGNALFLDTQSMEYDAIPVTMADGRWWILNTRVQHALGSGEYNARRAQCEEILYLLKKKSFREVALEDLKRDRLGDLLYRRARHVVSEMARTVHCRKALVERDWSTVGTLLYSTHESLQNDYEVSCDELDFIVQYLRDRGVQGARMMGGGFGGSVIALIQDSLVRSVIPSLEHDYQGKFEIDMMSFPVSPARGAYIQEKGS